jgi:hypothetical protein
VIGCTTPAAHTWRRALDALTELLARRSGEDS